MKSIIRTLGIAFIAALINFGLSFVIDINVIWVIAIVMFFTDSEMEGLIFAVASGTLFDIMRHGNIGVTSVSVVVVLMVFVLAKGVGFGARSWQKAIISIISVLGIFLLNSLLGDLIDGGTIFSFSYVADSIGKLLLNSGVTAASVVGFSWWREQHPRKPSVKL